MIKSLILLTHHIRIPADILAIIDVVEDPHIRRLQASLRRV
ncbi:hypothetical protein HMPREF1551_01602 [Capnocytophaga sp. oral taxon 863 str. F0517]|nr:hypothetical protein [Capnocytophaga sp. oral taxon 863]ERI62996.1 hypothetical protein HMPREF1551_01602 [Capnocytophaga sp. oral taxon 863 str. F0517]